MKTLFLTLAAFCALYNIRQTAHATTADTPANPTETPAILKTQDFESGARRMSTVDAEPLKRFLQDLNQRKDWDYACHNRQPEPEAAYLSKWVELITSELESRGYYFDAAGQLHRPGMVVPVR